MSIFGDHFTALMKSEGPVTQQELSEASGVDRASISRYMSGKQLPVVEQLVRLVMAISPEKEKRVELMIAYLQEVASRCHSAGFDERHYQIQTRSGTQFSSLGEDFEFLAKECSRDPIVRAAFTATIELLKSGREAKDEVEALHAVIQSDTSCVPKIGGMPADQILAAEKARRAALRASKQAS